MSGKEKKPFDCVAMKRDIQKKLARGYRGLSDEEKHRRMMEDALRDPSVGPFLKKIMALRKAA
jgi:hypothetical protein